VLNRLRGCEGGQAHAPIVTHTAHKNHVRWSETGIAMVNTNATKPLETGAGLLRALWPPAAPSLLLAFTRQVFNFVGIYV
jgi:hypothetical protein